MRYNPLFICDIYCNYFVFKKIQQRKYEIFRNIIKNIDNQFQMTSPQYSRIVPIDQMSPVSSFSLQRNEGTEKIKFKRQRTEKQVFRKQNLLNSQMQLSTIKYHLNIFQISRMDTRFLSIQLIQERKTSIQLRKIFIKMVKRLLAILLFIEAIKRKVDKKKIYVKFNGFKRKSVIPLKPDDIRVSIWNRFIQFHLILASICYPIYIGFINKEFKVVTFCQFVQDTSFWSIFILYLFIIFLVDMFSNFIICNFDENKRMLISLSSIAYRYLQTWLLLDLISIFPYELVFPNDNGKFQTSDYFQLLKLLKIVKYFVYQPPTYTIITIEPQDSFRVKKEWLIISLQTQVMLKIVINTLLLVHIFACLWYYTARYDYFDDRTWVANLHSDTNDLFTLYITSFYWATQTVTVVGYGDISCQTSAELNLTIIWMLIGVGFYSFTIGNLTAILYQSDTNSESIEELRLVETLTSQIQMPEEVIDELTNFVRYNVLKNPFWNNQSRRLLNTLSTQLRKFLILSAHAQALCRVPFFQLDANFVCEILPQMTFLAVQAFHTIYREGQPSNEIYYLMSGEVRITNSLGDTLITIAEGSIFGETEAIESVKRLEAIKRKFFCMAATTSVMMVCPSMVYLKKINNDQFLSFELNQLYLRRRILLQEAEIKLKNAQRIIKRSEGRVVNNSKELLQVQLPKRRKAQFNFRKSMGQDQFQDELLGFLVGQKQKRKVVLRQLFQKSVKRIIDYMKKQGKTSSSENKLDPEFQTLGVLVRRSSIIKRKHSKKKVQFILFHFKNSKAGKTMIQNFHLVCQEESKMQIFLNLNKKKAYDRLFKLKCGDIILNYRQAKQIDNRIMSVCYSKWDQIIISEINQEKQLQQKMILKRKEQLNNLIELMRSSQIRLAFQNLQAIQKYKSLIQLFKYDLFRSQQLMEKEIGFIQILVQKFK